MWCGVCVAGVLWCSVGFVLLGGFCRALCGVGFARPRAVRCVWPCVVVCVEGLRGRVFCGVMLGLEAPKASTQQPREGGFGAPGLSFLIGRGNGRILLSELTVLLEGCMRS